VDRIVVVVVVVVAVVVVVRATTAAARDDDRTLIPKPWTAMRFGMEEERKRSMVSAALRW
jgi:hypothetical protein